MVRPAWPCRVDQRAPARQWPGGTGALPGHRRGRRDGASLAGAPCGNVTVGRVLVA